MAYVLDALLSNVQPRVPVALYVVEVRTRVKTGEAGATQPQPRSRVKIEHEYEVVVVERGGQKMEIVAVIASTTLACVDRDGRPRALPEWLMVG